MEIVKKTSNNFMEFDDNFKKKFKYYKANKPKPSFHDVISVDVIKDDKVGIHRISLSFLVLSLQ